MGKKLLIAAVILVVVLGGLFAVEKYSRRDASVGQHEEAEADDSEVSGHVGQTLPDIELVDHASGNKVSLHSFKGKVVLINFWASWCEACIEEMPSIVKLHGMLKNEGFELVSVNVDEDPRKAVPPIIKQFGMSFPVFVDANEKLAEAFNVVAIPFNIVVGKDLKVLWTESGEKDWASEKTVQQLRGHLKQ